MSVTFSPIGNGTQFFGANGLPLNGGFLKTFQAGTTTPQVTYTTSAGNVENLVSIPLATDGRPPNEIWLTVGIAYKFELTDALGIPIPGGTYDNISGVIDSGTLSSVSGSSLVGFIQAGAGAVARTVHDKLLESISVKDFGAVGDGVTDDTAAIQAAINFVSSLTYRPNIYIPAGCYVVSSALLIGAEAIVITGDGAGRANGTGSFTSLQGNTVIKYVGPAMPVVPTTVQTAFVGCGVFTIGWFGVLNQQFNACRIENIAISCNGNAIGVYAADQWNSCGALRNLLILNPTTGVYLQDHAYSNVIENVFIQGMTTYGMVLANNCHSTDIVGCDLSANSNGGTETPANYIWIGKDGQSSNVTISHCNFDPYRVTDYVIKVNQACKGFVFRDNYVELHDAATVGCLAVESSIGVNICGNRFSGQSGTAVYAVELQGSVIGAIVEGNYFSGWSNACIRLGNGSSYVSILGNGIADSSIIVNDQNNGTERNNFIYQEYVFTPALKFGGGNTGMTGSFTGKATQIGDRLTFNLRINLTAKGSSSGVATVSGLPLASDSQAQQSLVAQATGSSWSSLTGVVQANISTSTTSIDLFQTSASGQSTISDTVFTNSSSMNISGQYCL